MTTQLAREESAAGMLARSDYEAWTVLRCEARRRGVAIIDLLRQAVREWVEREARP